MRKTIMVFMIMAVACTAIAQDFSNSKILPVKNKPTVTYIPPAEVKQGGDTILDATVIAGIPYSNAGTTCGSFDDYDEVCPNSDSTSPDVVYTFVPGSDMVVTVDLCDSGYDTKTYIYDAAMSLVGCNDDFYFDPICGEWTSKIESAALLAGGTYYIVIDGYGGECGDYVLNVTEFEECVLDCPADAVAEGEPPLTDGYIDVWNDGCFNDPLAFQSIDWTNDEDGIPPYDGSAWLCGVSGWYSVDGSPFRDTDWFSAIALETGMMDFTVEAEYTCYIMKMATGVCDPAVAELFVIASCGTPTTLSFPVTAGEEIWLWVGPSTFSGPVNEFTYFATLTNNYFDAPVPIEDKNWGGVKALYR